MAEESIRIPALEDLLSRVALKDRSAFDRLYEKTSSRLFAVTLRVLENRTDAEEALQEAYIRIWNKAGYFASIGVSPMLWLLSIARNCAIDLLRRRRAPMSSTDERFDLADDSPSPERAAQLSAEAARLRACLEELADERADLIREVYFSGQTHRELAESRKLPLGTVKSWIRRSLLKLHACVKRFGNE